MGLNLISLMNSEDALSSFWAQNLGITSDRNKTFYCKNYFKNQGISYLYKAIEEEIEEYNTSYLVIESSDTSIDPFLIFDLKEKYQLKVILFAPDDEHKFDLVSSTYATISDFILTTDFVAVSRYKMAGLNAFFWLHPVYFDNSPNDKKSKKYDVSFLGRIAKDMTTRVSFFNYLDKIDSDLKISFFGSASSSEWLSIKDMYSVFRESKINLNFSGVSSILKQDNPLINSLRGSKLRPYEIAAAGGFCISEFSITLAKVFDDGVDIVFSNSNADMVKKINFYLKHPEEAEKIAFNGHKKVKNILSERAIKKRLSSYMEESENLKGKNLYGEDLKPLPSRKFSIGLFNYYLQSSMRLLISFRLKSFLGDLGLAFHFLGNILSIYGFGETSKVCIQASFNFMKFILSSLLGMLKFSSEGNKKEIKRYQ